MPIVVITILSRCP